MTENPDLQCGYIKAKFPLLYNKELWEHPAYAWTNEVGCPRVTLNFIYLALGHTDIPDSETARRYIKTISELGGKITRLDFCIDYLGILNFDAFYRLHDNKEKPIPSMHKSPSGKTVYVGKRASARMLRVYDKRGEILAKKKTDIGFDLTRIEIEIKRNWVPHYKYLFMSGQESVIVSDIQELYGLRNFCKRHKPSKPDAGGDKSDSVWRFIVRFKNVIGCAYKQDVEQFLEIIGGLQDV